MRHCNHTYQVLVIIALFLHFFVDTQAQEVKDAEAVPLARVHREGLLVTDSLVNDTLQVDTEVGDRETDSLQEGDHTLQISTQTKDTSMVHITLTADSLMKFVNPKRKNVLSQTLRKRYGLLWSSLVEGRFITVSIGNFHSYMEAFWDVCMP